LARGRSILTEDRLIADAQRRAVVDMQAHAQSVLAAPNELIKLLLEELRIREAARRERDSANHMQTYRIACAGSGIAAVTLFDYYLQARRARDALADSLDEIQQGDLQLEVQAKQMAYVGPATQRTPLFTPRSLKPWRSMKRVCSLN
jgi:hypothetical protein